MTPNDRSEALMEIRKGPFIFRVTRDSSSAPACFVWVQGPGKNNAYRVLGRFSTFDKRAIVEFARKFVTNDEFRRHIAFRRYEKKIGRLSPSFFNRLQSLTGKTRDKAYRALYDLNSDAGRPDLARKRRLLAKRFHPDAGGDSLSMRIINEAYDYLLSAVVA